MQGIDPNLLRLDVERWLGEDVGFGDVTTRLTIDSELVGRAELIFKQAGVVAGLPAAAEVFRAVDSRLEFNELYPDGSKVDVGSVVATVSGHLSSVLTAERLALNLIQRLSGIATKTAEFVEKTEGTKAKILDTRKTTPGLRYLEKYAVRVGGGQNHRFGLFDGVLIKDNHIAAAGGVVNAVTRARAAAPHTLVIEVEVNTMAELDQALSCGAGAILLDNMTTSQMTEAVLRIAGSVPVEASGNMSLDRVGEVAACGVDLISVGALTHSSPALDVSLDISIVN